MRSITTFFFLLFACTVFCQGGFFNRYTYNGADLSFGNLQINDDTIIIHGIIMNPEPPHQQGLIFMKLDTFGQVLHQYVNYNPDGKSRAFASTSDQTLLKIEDGSGYISMGGYLGSDVGAIIKLDNQGKTVWEFFFSAPPAYLIQPQRVIELDDGFLVAGPKYTDGEGADALLIKIDTNGNEKWRKTFGKPDIWDAINSIVELNRNEILLGGGFGSSIFAPLNESWYVTTLTAIDSLGNVKWILKDSTGTLESSGIANLHLDKNGNYIGTGIKEILGDTLNQFIYTQAKFIIRDTSFNMIFEKSYDEPGYLEFFSDMIPMSDGGWTVVGRNKVDGNPDTGLKYHTEAWILRLDENADTIWTHSLLLFPELRDTLGTAQYFHSVAELSSGSVVASGYYEDYWALPGDPYYSGILVKIDKNGCLDTLLCPSVSTSFEMPFSEKLSIYPNPAFGQVNLFFGKLLANQKSKKLRVFDLTGKLIQTIKLPDNQSNFTWQREESPSGLYFYQISDQEKILHSGKIILQ